MPTNTKSKAEKAAIKRRQRERIKKGELAEAEKRRQTDLMGTISEMDGVPKEVKQLARQVKKNMGAPTKLRPALAARLLSYIVDGNYISTACKAAGVRRKTFVGWMKAAEAALEDAEAVCAAETARIAAEADEAEASGDEERAEALRQAEDGLSPLDFLPEDRRLHVHLLLGVEMAEGKAEMQLLKKASKGDRGWQAQIAILEKRFREGWGKKTEMEVNHHGDADRPIVFSVEPPEERAARVAGILQRAGAVGQSDASGELGGGEEPSPSSAQPALPPDVDGNAVEKGSLDRD